MADINKRKRDDNDTGEAVGTGVGAFTGDTMASALDPFGTVAVAGSGRALDDKAGEGTVDDDKHGSGRRNLK
jgi:hypothetical protein